SQVIPEYVALAGEELHVPGHDFQCLPRHQRRRGSAATDRQGFAGIGAPGQAEQQHTEQDGGEDDEEQGVAQQTGHGSAYSVTESGPEPT
ncbi:hypothetical protein, partial [Psychrobacter sp. TB20-MNA-CIBAN-0197]|uniref:hypothetical protein n=1 Tax=Psychrobacter sp. TB20-MNA-CIBAN-0197 TaxID=3140453 RepID=UPI00332A0CBD